MCLHCGGQLGKKFNIPGELTGDALLEQIYHQMESCRPFDQRFDGGAYRTSLSMRAYWYMEQDDLTLGAKNAQFLKLFHAEDQGVVEDWDQPVPRRGALYRPAAGPKERTAVRCAGAGQSLRRSDGKLSPFWTTTFQPSRSRCLRIWTAI